MEGCAPALACLFAVGCVVLLALSLEYRSQREIARREARRWQGKYEELRCYGVDDMRRADWWKDGKTEDDE